ncbi:SapC family protein [Halomonas piscis]|uniref:SapC family protein n=1 Tax=Halomonas piscis TaxID=3031727 RepID=A0ABY9Z2X4_9GAMM|nr:SapC family protein [Halomonas piscis]WNK21203.1 SapC family protein [Halomonas piscis]
MPQWTALSATAHRDKRLLPRDGYRHAAHDPVVPVLLAELNRLIPHYALGFITRADAYLPVALLSLDGERNLYVAPDGRWIGSYVPALMRSYPFALADGQEGNKILAVDVERLSDDGGEPLFEDGEPSATVQQTLDFLQQCEANRQQTQAATQALQQAGVIAQWPLTIQRHGEDAEPKAVKGLYRIDEAALNALDAETLATLQGAPLALAYAQMFSTAQLEQLSERDKRLKDTGDVPENLDGFFGEDDDELSFDFD